MVYATSYGQIQTEVCNTFLASLLSDFTDYQRTNMPLCELNTNLPKAKVDGSFIKELSQHVASIVNKPERGVTLRLNPDQLMIRAGTQDPMVTMTITGFLSHHFTKEMREKWMTSLTAFLSEKLGIDDHDRIIVVFHVIDPTCFGISGELIANQLV